MGLGMPHPRPRRVPQQGAHAAATPPPAPLPPVVSGALCAGRGATGVGEVVGPDLPALRSRR